MSPEQVTVAWGFVQLVQLVTWSVAFLQTLRAPAMVRLPVLLASVPAMFGTLVFSLFVETFVVGHPSGWAARDGAWELVWQPWWTGLAAVAPIVVAMGSYALWLPPRTGWSMSARLAGMASAAVGITVLASMPAP